MLPYLKSHFIFLDFSLFLSLFYLSLSFSSFLFASFSHNLSFFFRAIVFMNHWRWWRLSFSSVSYVKMLSMAIFLAHSENHRASMFWHFHIQFEKKKIIIEVSSAVHSFQFQQLQTWSIHIEKEEEEEEENQINFNQLLFLFIHSQYILL